MTYCRECSEAMGFTSDEMPSPKAACENCWNLPEVRHPRPVMKLPSSPKEEAIRAEMRAELNAEIDESLIIWEELGKKTK